jgi:hypothetical protein
MEEKNTWILHSQITADELVNVDGVEHVGELKTGELGTIQGGFAFVEDGVETTGLHGRGNEPENGFTDYDPDYRRERTGNNRYHVPRDKAKAKRKARSKAQQAQRRRK